MGVVLDNRGHIEKIRGYSTPLKRHSENTAHIVAASKKIS